MDPAVIAPPDAVSSSPSIAALQGKAPLGVPARITHDGEEGDLRFAVVPLPTYPTPVNTLAQRKSAISSTYSGRLAEAVDLYRSTVLQDGFFDGILRTMADGILQLPLSFAQGTPEMCSALLNADGTAGDYSAMHPLEECAQIFKDGLIGFPGLGQYMLMCWNCGWTDHQRVIEELEEGIGGSGSFEVCGRCSARRDARPLGRRELFRLEWRDCRWLDQNPVTFQWYYSGRTGRIQIIDGDGEWFMFLTTPRLESWRHGIWIWASLYALFSRDAQYDAQNTSQVTAPTPVLSAKKPVPEATRAAAEQRIRQLGFDNRIVLNGEWEYSIVSADAAYKDICSDIVNRCSDAFETGLTGNVMGRAARTAFTDAGIYHRTTAERRGAAADLWMRQIREKGLVHWGRDNYNSREVPVGCLDVRSPEDKLAHAKSLGELGTGIKGLIAGLKDAGVRPTSAWIQETMQTAGIRVEEIPRMGPQIFDLDPKDAIGGIKIDEWRKDQGLPPTGDPRGDMMMAAAIKAGGPATPVAATAEVAPVPAPGADPPASSAPTPSARLEDEDDEPDEDDEDSIRAELAAAMNQHGLASCRHGRTNACPTCGVRGVYSVVPGAEGQPHGWRVAWRALKRPGPRARLGRGRDVEINAAQAELDAALAALDALYSDDGDTARAREQERGPDGRFLPGPHAPKASDGLGRGKAAGEARELSEKAKGASGKANSEKAHKAAAKAHKAAAEKHREAAAASRKPEYKAAHENAAKAHLRLAKSHGKYAGTGAAKGAEDRPPLEEAKHALATSPEVRNAEGGPGVPHDAGTKLVASIKHPDIRAAQRVNPIGVLTIGDSEKEKGYRVGGTANSYAVFIHYDRDGGGPGLEHWDPRGASGKSRPKTISSLGKTGDEKRELTFAHELGHHLLFAADERYHVVEDAYKKSMASKEGPITRYAEDSPHEYFAETFSYFSRHPDRLKTADPVGHAMVLDVLERAKKPRT